MFSKSLRSPSAGWCKVLAAVGLAIGISTGADASVIQAPISATTNIPPSSSPIDNAINQSGLSANYVSGVTDFGTYIAGNPTHFNDFGNDWTTRGLSGVIDFDLGGPFNLASAAIWNFGTGGGNASYGLLSLRIITALDAAFTSNIVDHGIVNLAIVNTAQVFSLGSVAGQFVRFTDFTNNGSTIGFGLGEVAFEVTSLTSLPEPPTLMLLGLGLAALALPGGARPRRPSR